MSKFVCMLVTLCCVSMCTAQMVEEECVSRRQRRNATYWEDKLGLQVVPTRTLIAFRYASEEMAPVPEENYPPGSVRPFGTFALGMIKTETPTFIHKLPADSIMSWMHGSTLRVYTFKDGEVNYEDIGLAKGKFSVTVKADTWLSAVVKNKNAGKFTLIGISGAPGVGETDLTMGKRDEMIANFPDHAELITKVTPDPSMS